MKKALLATTALTAFMLIPGQAAADPISMAVASVASSVFAAGGVGAMTFSLFGATLTGWGAVFAQFAIRAALGYALNSLSGGNRAASRGYTVNSIGPALPHQLIYGEVKVGGAVFYQTLSGGSNGTGATNNRYLHRMVAFAGHEVDSFTAFYIDDEEVTLDGSGNVTAPAKYSGIIRITSHVGTDTQAADSNAVSEITEWTSAHQAKGVAYAHVRYDYDTTNLPNGVPTLRAKIKGKKVYDPRTDTTVWSDNPALCIRDYVTSAYGLNAPASEIYDDVFITAANICDEDVSGAKRFTCNGATLLDATPESIITALTSSMGGFFWYAQGQWGCKAANYVAPTLELNEDHLRGALNISTRNSLRDNFNTVHGLYRGEETEWQESDYTEVTSASFVTEDGGEENVTNLNLLFTDTDVMAQRVANIALKRNRQQITVNAPFTLEALEVGIGDTVMITNQRIGWTQKVFEVNDWRFASTDDQDLQINLLLREIDSTVFA